MQLNVDQQKVLDSFKEFIEDEDTQVFLLKGSAGTGKTTLLKFIINYIYTIILVIMMI